MSRYSALLAGLIAIATSACTSSPIRPLPPRLPIALDSVTNNATNAGRVESIAVNPTNRNHAIIAMDFGGLWKTHGGGNAWFRVVGLPAVLVRDIEFGSDGRTVVAAVFRDNQTINGGGIYVSRDGGDRWVRPPTGMVPISNRTPNRTSAYSVSHARDERGLWYVGTDFGIAISRDDGVTWTHISSEPLTPGPISGAAPVEGDRQQDAAQSVLAMPGGKALAMTRTAVKRSDDHGAHWRKVIEDNFRQSALGMSGPGNGNNKMDGSQSWAFIFLRQSRDGSKLWFYELDTDTKTLIPFPQGKSRGPFVRVSKDEVGHITIWVGAGWDGYFITRDNAESIRSIQASDWESFIRTAGIHADMGDMGVDGDLQPAYVGSDGGIFKPHPTEAKRWISAAVPGSGMNSLQIMDLAGTNVTGSDGRVATHLYFATQDNKIWASPDGGNTWPHSDDQEGYGLEVRGDAVSGEQITAGYRAIGAHAQELRFSDALLINSRAVPNVNQSGQALTGLGLPFFLSQEASTIAKPSVWVRLRRSDESGMEVYVSSNSGSNWVKTGNLNFSPAGEIKRTAGGAVAWVPVNSGGFVPRIGLIALTPTAGLNNNTIQTYDDSDLVRLPGNGGLGQRWTMFDTHAVYGVHPVDWKFLIAPDIYANDVKVSRDGGKSWTTDIGLTKQVLRGGELLLYDDNIARMEVTEIAFDPYLRPPFGNRIFVGTRDAGLICSADGGQTWRTIKDSNQIKYITGFHFLPNGGVYVSGYGSGIWFVEPSQTCPESYDFPWDMSPPVFEQGAMNLNAAARSTEIPDAPRGIADPGVPKLFLTTSIPASGIPVLGPDNVLIVSGRGFPPGKEVALSIRGEKFLDQKVQVDQQGRFTATGRLPEELEFVLYTLEAIVKSNGECPTVISSEFAKAFDDDQRDKPR